MILWTWVCLDFVPLFLEHLVARTAVYYVNSAPIKLLLTIARRSILADPML